MKSFLNGYKMCIKMLQMQFSHIMMDYKYEKEKEFKFKFKYLCNIEFISIVVDICPYNCQHIFCLGLWRVLVWSNYGKYFWIFNYIESNICCSGWHQLLRPFSPALLGLALIKLQFWAQNATFHNLTINLLWKGCLWVMNIYITHCFY